MPQPFIDAFLRLLDPPPRKSGIYRDKLLTERDRFAPELIQSKGLYLAKTGPGRFLRHDGESHLLTVAPTGAGKGVSCVLPNAVTYPSGFVALDIKGEIYRHTAPLRPGRVVRVDPFGVCGAGGAAFNPMANIREDDPELLDKAGRLADALVVARPDEREPHWNEKAKHVLKSLLLFVVAYATPEDRHPGSVRDALAASEADWNHYLALMRDSDRCGGLLRQGAAEIDRMGEQEKASVMSVCLRHTAFLANPRVRKGFREGPAFRAGELFVAGPPAALYLILPPDKLAGYARLLRIWLTALTDAAVARGVVPPGAPRVLFLLDEVAQLGRLDLLPQAVSLLRGYGCRFWLFWQDLGQLKALYPNDGWRTFLSNCGIHQYFGTRDYETAKMISDILGKTTVRTRSANNSRGQNGQSISEGSAERARELLSPTEIIALPADRQLLFLPGLPPANLPRPDFRTDPIFRRSAP